MSPENQQVYLDQFSSAEDSLAKMLVVQENGLDSTEAELDCGLSSCVSSKSCSQLGLLERMLKDSLPKDSTKCLGVWKERVTPCKHIVFQLAPSVRRINEKESLLLPTVTTQEVEYPNANLTETGRRLTADGNNSHSLNPADRVRLLPTLTCNTGKNTSMGINFERRAEKRQLDGVFMIQIGIKNGLVLQPAFAEWMMGFPIGWTDLPVSEMQLYQPKRSQFCKPSRKSKKVKSNGQ